MLSINFHIEIINKDFCFCVFNFVLFVFILFLLVSGVQHGRAISKLDTPQAAGSHRRRIQRSGTGGHRSSFPLWK
jgi:hypothetical protein